MAELTRRDFRAAILYDYKRGLSVDECSRTLKRCFGELRAPSRTTVFNRFRDFKSGRFGLEQPEDQQQRHARTELHLVCQHLEKVRELVRVDPSISQLEIAKKLGLDLGVVQTIVNQALRLGQLNLQWTPCALSDLQRALRHDWAAFMLDKFDDGRAANTARIVACFDTWIYKCRTVRKSARVTTEYWTFESSSSVVDKRMVICFYSAAGVSMIASLNNLRLLSSRDLVESCLNDVMGEWPTNSKDKHYLYIETVAHSSTRLLEFLHDRRVILVTLPESSPDLALGGSFLEPAFWTSIQKQRFATQEDAVMEYQNCLSSAVPEMWDELFNWWFKRMRKCVASDGDYVEQINFNLDLSGCDAASMVVNPNLVMPSHVSVRTPTPSHNANAAESTSATASHSTTTITTTALGATTNGIKRHFNFAPKLEPKQEKPEQHNGHEADDAAEAEHEAESEDERHYENEASSEDDSEESESEDDEAPNLPRATAQPHGLKLTIPSSAAKAKTTLLLPASSIKTLSPTLLKASQQQAAAAGIKVNGLPAGIRLQNFKIVGPNGNVQQLRRQIYGTAGVQAHIVAQAQAQQQQHLLQQQLAAAVVATAAGSPNGARKQDKELDALAHEYDDKAYPKPAYSYSCLIAMALKNSQTGSLPVSEIYNFMCEHFPYFKTAPNGWKNSVRHNLSLNKCFEKIEKPAGNGNQRKGCLWAINPAKVAKMDEEVQKWSRKDPLAIKKAMIYPDHLELLERGEMKFVGSGSNGDLSEETESSGDEEAEGPDEPSGGHGHGHGHQLAANSVTDSYDESSQDCDVDVSEQLYDEIDIDDNKDALHMQLNISSKQDDYQLIPSAKRQKTLTGTLQANYVYQPVATARRKTPLTFLTTGAAAGSFLKIE